MNPPEPCGCQGKTIAVLFIRHGFSCANYKKQKGFFSNISKAFSYDPPLTNHAIRDILETRDKIKSKIERDFEPDIVLSSTLLRAQQTANFLFPGQAIYVAPYIKELGSTLDNVANEPYIQKQKDAQAKKLYNSQRYADGKEIISVDSRHMTKYKFVLGKESNNKCIRELQVSWEEANKVDYNAFINWLEKMVGCLLKLGNEEMREKNLFNIVVVGHSSFMAKHIQTMEDQGKLKKLKPKNVGVVQIFFCYRNGILHEVNQERCHCPGIASLQDEQRKDQAPWCNGVVFRGINQPEKGELSGFSTDNCDRM